MITEDYVSFEVAKLLKEKGFHEPCIATYNLTTKDFAVEEIYQDWTTCWKTYVSAPTLQMVCKWLREVHNIFIDIYLPSHSEHEDTIYHGTFSFDIFNLNTKVYVYCTWNENEFNSYEEAVEAALKYTLENLI